MQDPIGSSLANNRVKPTQIGSEWIALGKEIQCGSNLIRLVQIGSKGVRGHPHMASDFRVGR